MKWKKKYFYYFSSTFSETGPSIQTWVTEKGIQHYSYHIQEILNIHITGWKAKRSCQPMGSRQKESMCAGRKSVPSSKRGQGRWETLSAVAMVTWSWIASELL
jgi:hypothetical protein